MNEESYSVVIHGIAEGQKPGEVKRKLSRAFKKSPEEMDVFFRGKPVVVKRGLDRIAALKYKKVIEKSGAACKIQGAGSAGALRKEPAKVKKRPKPEKLPKLEKITPPKKMVCPNCGLEQEEAPSCKKCGILVQRAIAAQTRHAENMNQYYEPSGRVGLKGTVFMIVIGLAASLIAGFLYGYAGFIQKSFYIHACLTMLCGIGVGYAVGFGGKLGHVRSRRVLLLFGFLFGLLAGYMGWVGWIFAKSGHEVLALSPMEVGTLISFTTTGAWTVSGWTAKGLWLYLFRALETVLIVGLAGFTARARLSPVPYCEKCRKWVKEKIKIEPLDPVTRPEEFRSRLELGDYSSLVELKKKDDYAGDYSKIELSGCPGCRELYLVSVLAVKGGKKVKRRKNAPEDFIVKNLVIPGHDFDFIRGYWH